MAETSYPPSPNLSKTSIGTFDECERQYALHYLWIELSQPVKREAWFQRALMKWSLLVGQVVDDVITEAIRRYYDKREWPENWEKGVERILEEYETWTEVFIEHYRTPGERPPKDGDGGVRFARQPLENVFYGEYPTQEDWEGARKRCNELIEVFRASGLMERLAGYATDTWRPPPRSAAPWFEWEGIPVYAKYDFAITAPEETLVFEWKTGRMSERAENDALDQLHTYAFYAQHAWNSEPESTRLVGVWLGVPINAEAASQCIHEARVDPQRLDRLKDRWRKRYALLNERLAQVKERRCSLLEAFPPTGVARGRCKACNFRLCEYHPQSKGFESTGGPQ
ncbi:MAG: PD-(D/E)XK nuclease family protein [Fimbriimonadaceae bacterium]|nr:PD-(D/E)XK nuclease family protein [Fimbriimonadaceae bacterium]